MTMKVRAVLILITTLTVLFLASCGHYTCGITFGASSCTPSGTGLGGPGSGTVFAYLLDESGNAGGVGMAADRLDVSTKAFVDLGTTFTAPPLPQSVFSDGGTVVVNLAKKYLYIPFSDGTVWGYAIDGTTGALTAVPNIPYAAPGGNSITSDPAGRYLYVSDFSGGNIAAFAINPNDGSLTPVPGSPFPSGINPAQLTTDGLGKFLYATAGPGGAVVAAMSINQSTGALTQVGIPLVSPMEEVLGEKSGKFLLGISGQAFDNHIFVFSIDPQTGAIALVGGAPFATLAVPVSLVVHPSGSFVYTFNGTGTSMEGYQIGSTGTLTALSGSPFPSVMLDVGEFDQTGKFLFGVGSGHLGFPNFGPYATDPTTGFISATTYQLQGFPGAGFAVSDLDDAP